MPDSSAIEDCEYATALAELLWRASSIGSVDAAAMLWDATEDSASLPIQRPILAEAMLRVLESRNRSNLALEEFLIPIRERFGGLQDVEAFRECFWTWISDGIRDWSYGK